MLCGELCIWIVLVEARTSWQDLYLVGSRLQGSQAYVVLLRFFLSFRSYSRPLILVVDCIDCDLAS